MEGSGLGGLTGKAPSYGWAHAAAETQGRPRLLQVHTPRGPENQKGQQRMTDLKGCPGGESIQNKHKELFSLERNTVSLVTAWVNAVL